MALVCRLTSWTRSGHACSSLMILPLSEKKARARHGAGIALKNVHQRLQLFFGPAYGLEITSAAGIGTQIELCMPAPSEMRDSYHAERAF